MPRKGQWAALSVTHAHGCAAVPILHFRGFLAPQKGSLCPSAGTRPPPGSQRPTVCACLGPVWASCVNGVTIAWPPACGPPHSVFSRFTHTVDCARTLFLFMAVNVEARTEQGLGPGPPDLPRDQPARSHREHLHLEGRGHSRTLAGRSCAPGSGGGRLGGRLASVHSYSTGNLRSRF